MPAPQLDAPALRAQLKLKSLQTEQLLTAHHGNAIALLTSGGVRPGGLRRHAAKLLASGATAAALIIAPPQSLPVKAELPPASQSGVLNSIDLEQKLSLRLNDLLPPSGQALTEAQENQISRILHQLAGLHATAVLEGNRLNTAYGIIGAEQHLPRFPGDTADLHRDFIASGITPGRGAWGFFAAAQNQLTADLELKERYYIAVQTLYLPDWQVRLAYLRDWYRYRKMAVVNPKNGRVVIAVVGDSGPAAWTGKQFGGSPEVMAYLRLQDGARKGPVLVYFVDDPDNQVPLGPLQYHQETGLPLLTSGQ